MPIIMRSLPVITLGLTATQLTADTSITSPSITIQADKDNVGVVSVGGVDIAPGNGIQVEPRESAVIEYTSPNSYGDNTEFHLSDIYALSSNAGDKVRVVYMRKVKYGY